MGNCVGTIICTNMDQKDNNNNINGTFKAMKDQTEMEELVISRSSHDHDHHQHHRRRRRSKQSIIINNIAGKRNMTVKMKLKLRGDIDQDQDQDQDHQRLSRSGSSSSSSSSRVRIKVVMSQKELMKILNNDGSNYSSVDHLLTAIKNTRSSHANGGGGGGSPWKPALDSIIEDV